MVLPSEQVDYLIVKQGVDIGSEGINAGSGSGTIFLQNNVTIANAKNLAFGTGTGTKIGTAASQKLAFYGATPIVQATLDTSASNSDIVTALQNLGLVVAS